MRVAAMCVGAGRVSYLYADVPFVGCFSLQ